MDSATTTSHSTLAAPRLQWLQWAFVGVLFFLFYGPTLLGLYKDWEDNVSFSYGVLIPLITVYLVWQKRADLKQLPVCPTSSAAIPLLVAVILSLFGVAIGDSFTVRVSMMFVLASSIYVLFGRYFLKALAFPIFYLSLMIPVPYVFFKEFAYHLRFFDARLTENALQLLGIPIYREAYFLHLPNITLEVADMCAGLGSLFALFALGNFYVYFLPVRLRIKFLLVLSTLPIAIFANFVRITVVAIMAYYIGPITLDMLFHRFSGTTTFLLALTLLILFGELARNKWPQASVEKTSFDVSPIREDAGATRVNWRPATIAAGIFVCALSATALLNAGHNLALEGIGLKALPTALGSFSEAEVNWHDRYEDRRVDSAISRIYLGPDRMPIEAFIGYKGLQNNNDRVISPRLILPEHWNFAWIKPTVLHRADAASIDAMTMLIRNGNSARLVLYWYQLGRNTISGELDYRFELIRRLIFDQRTDGAVVRLATPIGSEESVEHARERLNAFAMALYPQITKVLMQ